MLDFIRKHQKWMLVFIIILVVPSFVFLGVANYQGMLSNDATLAQVKEQKISRELFNMEWRDRLNQLRIQGGNQFDISQVDVPQNRRAFLDQMINARVLHEQVLAKHYSATDDMVRQAIAADPQFHDEGRFSVQKYSDFLQRLGIDANMYQNSVRYSLALEQVTEPVTAALSVPVAVEKAVLASLLQERSVRLRLFEASTYFAENEPTEAEAKSWYEHNKESLKVPASVDAQYIILNEAAAVKAVPQPTDTELEQYYESNKARYVSPERRSINHIQLNLPTAATPEQVAEVEQKATELKQQLDAEPAKFAELAKQYSDDAGSKQSGGRLGMLAKGDIPELDELAFSPAETGIYGPLRIDNALHIIQLDSIEAAVTKPFADVRDDLIHEVRLQVASDRFAELSSELVLLANDAHQSLEDISTRLELPIHTVKGVGQAGMVAGAEQTEDTAIFTKYPQLRETLFSHALLEEGATSGVVELSPTELVVLKVSEHTPAYVPEFDKVKNEVVTAVKTEKSLAQAKASAEEAMAKLSSGQSTSLTDFDEPITVSRLMGNLPQSLLDAIMSAPVDNLPSYTTFWIPQGYVVARIESVQESQAADDGLKAQIEQLLLIGQQTELQRQMLYTLRNNMKVKVFDESERVINDVGME
ncbi:Peptidyl-prolyl cis-trans isomerase D [Oligella urethralis]|uniref:Periplasmic chaperone PpiD n=2 Tax=Oligella urethralis TaxID=90245 RepID=A0A2X1UMM0_9BURK|nr:SurA N-terminal domain-containing protein [Oligella urethralis]WOS37414.1 Peptidyl-prolyl cis-trans isomerase D [Oligella urethralis]SPY08396.1 Peptidyl-prolyl cis-trans isomerase D [Oligella urethralis]